MERFQEREGARRIVLFPYNKVGSPGRRRQVRRNAEGHLATPLMTKTPKRSGDLAHGETSEGEPTQRPCQTRSGPMHRGMRLARQVGIPSEDQAMAVRHSASAAERLCL